MQSHALINVIHSNLLSTFQLDKILQKIKLHYNIILSWYSMECLQDTAIIPRLIRSFIRLWPWVSTSHEMLFKFMKLLAILCDDSLPGRFYRDSKHIPSVRPVTQFEHSSIFSFLVCKAMTSVVIGNSQSMLQLVATYCTNESSKIKNPQSNLDVLELALRVVSNCCACFEGRNQINKVGHPSVVLVDAIISFRLVFSFPTAQHNPLLKPFPSVSYQTAEAISQNHIIMVEIL